MRFSATAITGFSFTTPAAEGTITGTNVAITVPPGTVLTSLTPTITVSEGAAVSPASGEAQDFSEPVDYVVTAADGTTETWTVTVTVLAPLTTITDITAYLSGVSGGATTDVPIPLPVNMTLDNAAWTGILGAIQGAGKYVDLDLSLCAAFTDTTGGGLYADFTFDPDYTISTGKGRIVSLVLPDAATSVKANPDSSNLPTFYHFDVLRSVGGTGVVTVGNWAFFGHYVGSVLESVNFPAVQTIGNYAFAYCSALASVSLPASLTSIGDNAFQGCSALTNITVDSGNTAYSASTDHKMLLNKSGDTLIAYPSATGTVTLPTTITSIGIDAFYNCSALNSVNLPTGGYAADNCLYLGLRYYSHDLHHQAARGQGCGL
jgi:hypothetical protein